MNQELPILYSRNTDGTVETWNIIVDNNKYYTIHGKENGLKVKSKPTEILEGKNLGRSNSTTPEEQAYLEAKSRWDKKVKSGGYYISKDDIDKKKFIEPMLANLYKNRPIEKIKFPVIVDRKYNGMRQVTHSQGPFTRKGEPVISAPHIFDSLKFLFNKYPNLVLDGELYSHKLRYELNELISLVNKKKHVTQEDLDKSKDIVEYYVYDGYGFTWKDIEITEDTKCSIRKQALFDLLSNIDYITVPEIRWAKSDEEVKTLFSQDIQDGYEGSMVRLDEKYEHKRTNSLLKVKLEDDDEAIILDIQEGEGNWSGTASKATVNWNGNLFDATFKGTYESRIPILKNKKDWIGKKVTFLHIGYTGKSTETAPKGLPCFPRIDPKSCFKE